MYIGEALRADIFQSDSKKESLHRGEPHCPGIIISLARKLLSRSRLQSSVLPSSGAILHRAEIRRRRCDAKGRSSDFRNQRSSHCTLRHHYTQGVNCQRRQPVTVRCIIKLHFAPRKEVRETVHPRECDLNSIAKLQPFVSHHYQLLLLLP